MTEIHFLIVFVVGIITGIINTLAGGGSLLTLPTLIFVGLEPHVANGTNRIAILVQSIFAMVGFGQKGISDIKLGLKLAIPTIIGAIVGARISLELPDEWFKKVLAVIMIAILVIILRKPKVKKQETPLHPLLAILIFFGVGVYGGFIQAGVGFFLIASLVLVTSKDLVHVNYYKVLIAGVYTVFALIVFIWNGKIDWIAGFTLAAGNGLGGWIGSHTAVAIGDKWLRWVLAIAVVVMAINLILRS